MQFYSHEIVIPLDIALPALLPYQIRIHLQNHFVTKKKQNKNKNKMHKKHEKIAQNVTACYYLQ